MNDFELILIGIILFATNLYCVRFKEKILSIIFLIGLSVIYAYLMFASAEIVVFFSAFMFLLLEIYINSIIISKSGNGAK